MKATVTKVGENLAVCIPEEAAAKLHVQAGSTVEMVVQDRRLIVTAPRRRYTIEELVDQITPDNLPDETFDDPPRGRETL